MTSPLDPDSGGYDAGSRDSAVPVDPDNTLRKEVVSRQEERFGGIKFGSAFFGWLTATGTAVLLTALVSGIAAAVGLTSPNAADDATDAAAANPETAGIIGAIVLVVVVFIAYIAGGYVAGRMARFSGAKQGVAVWLWAVLIAIVVAVITAIAGSRFNALESLNSIPRIPLNEGAVTTTAIITAIAVAVASLGGAVLGGIAGMRYHRAVDRVGLGRR